MQYFSTTCMLANGLKCVGMQFVAYLEGFCESQFYIPTAGEEHMSLQLAWRVQQSHYLRQMLFYLICIYFQITYPLEWRSSHRYLLEWLSGSAFPSGFHQSVTLKWWTHICLSTVFTQRMVTLNNILFK